MSNEKTDEFLSWRRRLAPPDALPDQGLDDKEVSWERLAERLREKPRRRTGYWIAAACLLLALIPATHFFRDRPARGAGVARVSHHSSLTRPFALPLSSRQPSTDQSASRRDALTTTTGTPSAASTRRERTSATHERTGATPSRPPAPAPILALIARPDDHPAVIADVAVPLTNETFAAMNAQQPEPRKKLRVVQINEISNSAGPAPSMATRFRSPFRIGLGVPDPGPSDDQPSRPGNASLLKIKLSSQNR